MSLNFTLLDYLILDGLFEPSDDESIEKQKKEDVKEDCMENRKDYLISRKANQNRKKTP